MGRMEGGGVNGGGSEREGRRVRERGGGRKEGREGERERERQRYR